MAANTVEIDVKLVTQQALSSLRAIEKQTKKTQTGFSSLGKSIIVLNQGFQLAKSAIGIATRTIGSFVDKAKEIEQITVQFQTLTGSVSSAKAIISDLQNFAATTPFQLPGIAKAAQQLLAFGFEQDKIIDKLQKIGDVAAGSGSDLKEVALIYGQVAAAGKLTGERLLQFQERAIPIGPAIAKTMGIAESSVKDAVSAGEVDLKTFEKAFASLSQTGGLFFEGMVRQSKTLSGVFSTLGDNVDLLQSDIGTAFLPTIKEVTVAIINLIQQNRELIKSFAQTEGPKILAAIFQGLGNSVKFLISAFNGLLGVWDVLRQGASYLIAGVTKTAEVFIKAAIAVKEFTGASAEAEKATLAQLQSFAQAGEEERANIEATMAVRQAETDQRLETIDTITEKLVEAAEIEVETNNAKNEAINESNKNRAKQEITLYDQIKQGGRGSLGDLFDFEKNTNAGRAANFKSTLQTISTLSESNNDALAAIGKAAAISTATIDGIVAVQKALASAPPPFNFILAGLVGTAAAANVAKISGVALAEGGLVLPRPGGVQATIAEAGKPELVIPLEDERAQSAAGSIGGNTFNISISGNVVKNNDELILDIIEGINNAVEFGNTELKAS